MGLTIRILQFLVTIGFIFYLYQGNIEKYGKKHSAAITALFVLSVFLHEMGHVITAHILGARVIDWGAWGIVYYVRISPSFLELAAWKGFTIAFAGPLVNLVMAFAIAWPNVDRSNSVWMKAAATIFGLGIMNLLPIGPLDGGKILMSFFRMIGMGPDLASGLLIIISIVLVVLHYTNKIDLTLFSLEE